jgi:dipeptidyl aminopeptidase/acylaminoacyl peptidase
MRLSAPRRASAAAAALLAFGPAAARAQDSTAARAPDTTARRAFRPADVYRVTTVAAPAVSPDGRRLAFTVTRVDERANRRRTEVWTAAAAGGPPSRLSWPDSQSTAPRFLPDGRLVFEVTPQGGRPRTYAVRPGEGDAAPVLATGLPPAGASWSRDGRVAVWADSITATADSARGEFTRADSAMRDPARGDTATRDAAARDTSRAARAARGVAMARPPFGAVTRPLDSARFDGRHVVDFPYKSNERGFIPNRATARRWNPTQLWTAAAGDTGRRALTTAAYSHRDAALSPDGRTVAFVADSALRPDSVLQAERDSIARLPYDRRRDSAERDEVDVYVQPVAGGAPRKLATLPGVESELAWGPDGKSIAFLWRPGRTKSTTLATVDVATGRVRDLLGDVPWEPEGFVWVNDRVLALHAQVGGRTALFRLGSGGGGAREVLGGRRRLSGFAYDRDRRTVAYVSTSMTRPTELHVAGADGTGERAVTSFNEALLREVAMRDAERFTFRSVGGLQIEGWLMKPFGYDSTRRHPLVLYIHGGPHSAYGENWFDEFQNLAGAGAMVLFTNPRGSTGYGGPFTYASRGRWGLEDYQDLMKAVDLAAARADVDSSRMGVTGGSYGGFMTAWITTRTDRFRAAQTDRMISDWTYWYGASDAQGLTEYEFFGKPWDNQPLYDNLSPIRFVAKVKTPTLIVQSEEDHRTPMGGAEMWFMALRKRGVPVEFVRYPRSTHELSRSGEPWLLVDRLGRLRQWFGHWLAEGGPTRTASGG